MGIRKTRRRRRTKKKTLAMRKRRRKRRKTEKRRKRQNDHDVRLPAQKLAGKTCGVLLRSQQRPCIANSMLLLMVVALDPVQFLCICSLTALVMVYLASLCEQSFLQ